MPICRAGGFCFAGLELNPARPAVVGHRHQGGHSARAPSPVLCRRIVRGVILRLGSRSRTRPFALHNRNWFVTNTLVVNSLNASTLARNVIWHTNHETTSPSGARKQTQPGQLGQHGSPGRWHASSLPVHDGIGATLPGCGTLPDADAPTSCEGPPETIWRACPAGGCVRADPPASVRAEVKLRVALA